MFGADEDKIPDITLPDNKELEEFILYYRQMITIYEAALRILTTRLDIIEKECLSVGRHSPIRSVTTRIKDPQSIRNKLRLKGFPLTLRSISENLTDVAGAVLSVNTFPISIRRGETLQPVTPRLHGLASSTIF